MTTATPDSAPAAPQRPGALRHLQLNLQLLDSGEVRVSTPQARGWAKPARGPDQLWHAMQMAFAQARLAGHAAWSGGTYGPDQLTAADDPSEPPRRPTPRAAPREGVSWARNAAARPDVADPADWLPLPDGAWLSPSGRRYRSVRIIGPVVARRAAMGLPTTYEAAVARAVEIDRAAAEAQEVARFWARIEAVEPESRWHRDKQRQQAAS